MAAVGDAEDGGAWQLETERSVSPIPFLAPPSPATTQFYEPALAVHEPAVVTADVRATEAACPVAASSLQHDLEALFKVDVAEIGDATLPVCGRLLREHFGIHNGSFRPRQQEVCLRVLHGAHTLAVCPTGWGKSLCYLFPMLVHRLLFDERRRAGTVEKVESKFCIVVSPLLALMADQVEKIRRCGALRAVSLSAQLAAAREAQLLDELASPHCSIDVVFVSPEKFIAHTGLRRLLREQLSRVAFVAVDEVHCVSRWAYDFRPTFMYLHHIVRDVRGDAARGPAYLCLTATATRAVQTDLQRLFHIEHTVVCTEARSHLQLDVVDLVERDAAWRGQATAVPPSQRVLHDAVLEAVRTMAKPMLVYVQTRADADELAGYLARRLGSNAPPADPSPCGAETTALFHSSRFASGGAARVPARGGGCEVRCYHAALSRQVRLATQRQFLDDEVDVLVATVAFGMGIDKPNLRSVLHAYAPASLESYVQETGRAGRDGGPSWCRLLYNPFDYYAARTRLRGSLVSLAEMTRVVHALLHRPTTHLGEPRCTLLSPAALAIELEVTEELIETVLFLLLTLDETGTGGRVLAAVCGGCALGFRVTQSAAQPGRRRRPREHVAAQDVSVALAQMDATDPIVDYCRSHPVVANQIDAANALRLSLDEFQTRLDALVASGTLQVRWRTSCPAYVVQLGEDFAAATTPAGVARLAQTLFTHYHGRLESQVRALRTMFAVLQAPTHERVQAALDEDDATLEAATAWQPPPRSLKRIDAVTTANAFVADNRARLHSSYEAARALLGVMPKSVIKYGKYAGQIPLSQSWYTHSPYFGALHEFDLDWVLTILAVHHLDDDTATTQHTT